MENRPRVFISRTIPAEALKMIEAECEVVVWDHDTQPPREKVLVEVSKADGVLSMLTEKIDAQVIAAATNLRVISNFAVGYDNIDVDAATARGIPVGNTPGILTETTADHAFMLLAAAARRLPESMEYIKQGKWQTWNPTTLLGQDIYGATLGIIGMGRIGHAVAKRAQGFGMRILYHGGSDKQFADETGGQSVDLETLLRESDFVTLHVPLTDETRHLIGKDEFVIMKSTAILINTARGGVVDTNALVDALKNDVIGGAALDVTDPEPIPPDHPLLQLPNCIVAPHTGSATEATRAKMADIAAKNLLAGLRGERLPHCVNPEVYEGQP